MIETLVPTVDISYRNGIRYLQHDGLEIRIPMKIRLFVHKNNTVEFHYAGVNGRYIRKTRIPSEMISALHSLIDWIIAEDELYEHNIRLHNLYYHPHPDKPHFYRASGNMLYVYTADESSRVYVGMRNNPQHEAAAEQLAIECRQDVLDTQWTAPPPITTIIQEVV